jgi:hypothetical protein
MTDIWARGGSEEGQEDLAFVYPLLQPTAEEEAAGIYANTSLSMSVYMRFLCVLRTGAEAAEAAVVTNPPGAKQNNGKKLARSPISSPRKGYALSFASFYVRSTDALTSCNYVVSEQRVSRANPAIKYARHRQRRMPHLERFLCCPGMFCALYYTLE